jgi:unsaturated rhamnogalacturonyl hydrolase
MKKGGLIILTMLLLFSTAKAQTLSEKMAATVMQIWKDSLVMEQGKPVKWTYDQGILLKGIEGIWKRTANPIYFQYMQKSMDNFVQADGTIRTYKLDDYNIDNILCGRNLLFLANTLVDSKYYKAAATLRSQLKTQPRTKEGGFWHKKRYPNQMWLDGLYMGEPFYAEWAAAYEPEAFNDIANQFVWMEKHARDATTGLLYHGWDESKEEKWANKTNGCSPNFWARAMGWYGVALVDVLEYFPDNHPRKKELIEILKRYSDAIQKVQDKQNGLWWDVLNRPSDKGNYQEASASCMFVYTIAKAVRLGWLPDNYLPIAKKGYAGIVKEFIETDNHQQTNLKGTVAVSGLGGTPYRDGSYEYYVGEKVVTNDPKGVGAFLLASNEMELLPTVALGKGKTVLLDRYFNREYKKDVAGVEKPHHYVWNQLEQNGFSFLGDIFRAHGLKTLELDTLPTASNLSKAAIYIIVDPDTKKETTNPNFIFEPSIKVISEWVKAGGVLVMMANDSANCELPHFNELAKTFGIHFDDQSRNMVKGKEYQTGAIVIPAGNEIFPNTKKIYLKEICKISVINPARAALTEGNDIIVAVAKYGKGTVFAVGDPWLYNEYTDGRKIPAEYENSKAANDLVKWILKQVKR